MERVFLITIIISVANINCHVINVTKNATSRYVLDKSENVPEVDDRVQSDGVSVYLEDVLVAIANQNWMEEEKPCLDRIHHMLHGLQNFTLWAVWDWDAQSSEPQGLLFRNRYQLGNFDQCMNAPWASTHAELTTKYCLAEILLERTDRTVRRKLENPFDPYHSALDYIQYRPPHTHPLNELTWGACVPSSCPPKTVERLLSIMLARSHLGTAGLRPNISITEPCQSPEDWKEYDGLFYAFMATMGLLILICLICTFLNTSSEVSENDKNTSGFIKAFCLKENASDLLKTKKEGLDIFYGIKFLTMCLIVLGHQLGNLQAGPISDAFITDKVPKTPLGLLILHDDLFVDTFFLISGFLASTYLISIEKMPNPLLMIFRRYMRMLVALAVVVFYTSAVFPYTGSGPLWKRVSSTETDLCRKNWWLNLLMVSNYVDSENMCLVISWYIPCDFHFFVVTVLLFWIYKHSSALGQICGVLVTIASIIVPGVVTYVNQLSAVQLFTYEFISNPRGSREFHSNYIKSHTRFAAYLVGVYSGYFFVIYKDKIALNSINKVWSIIGALSALILMLVVMVSGNIFLWWNYHPLEGAVYAALNRPAWAGSLALLVMCCVFGQVPLVTSFLSWYPWVPLSRLTYGLYLTHIIIIIRNVYTTRNPDHSDYFNILNGTAGVIFWSTIASLILWLFVEAPANRLLTLCFRPRVRTTEAKQGLSNDNFSDTRASVSSTSSQANLRANLPATIDISSKM